MSAGGWPFPKPPGQPGSGTPSSSPLDPLGPRKPPHQYSWSDRWYLRVVSRAYFYHLVRKQIPESTIGNYRNGETGQTTSIENQIWLAHQVPFLGGLGPDINRDVLACSRGEPIQSSAKQRVLALESAKILVYSVGLAALTSPLFRRMGGSRLLQRQRALEASQNPGGPTIANPGVGTAVTQMDSASFYARPTTDLFQRIEELRQRDMFLRGVFNQ